MILRLFGIISIVQTGGDDPRGNVSVSDIDALGQTFPMIVNFTPERAGVRGDRGYHRFSMYRGFLFFWVSFAALLLVCGVGAGLKSRAHQNSVLRMLAPEGVKISDEQMAGADTAAGVAEFVAILKKDRRPVPAYLRLVCEEYAAKPRESATFAVGCYWEGERDLGKLKGVVFSRTGMLGGDEVVQVRFDPAVIDYARLAGAVRKMSCYRGVRPREADLIPDPEQQHYLTMHPEYCFLPLTAGQATKVNAALGTGADADQFLSPAQLSLRKRLASGIALSGGSADWLSEVRPDRSRDRLAAYADALEDFLASWGD